MKVLRGEKRSASSRRPDHRGDPRSYRVEQTRPQSDHVVSTQRITHMLMALTGDPTDCFPGCPGIGPVKAAKILTKAEGRLWDAVVEAYAAKGLSEAEALVQARVARICRWRDYDYQQRKVKLWRPG